MHQDNKKVLEILAKRIKHLRNEKGCSLNSFVFNRGLITTATLSRIENSLVDVKFTTLVKISQMFEISLEELVKDLHFDNFEDL